MAAAKPPAKAPPPRTAAEIAKPLELSEAAMKLIAPGLPVRAFFEALAAKPELVEDALKFLAAALPKREAVWWGFCCLKDSLKPPLPEAGVKAMADVEKWVRNPTEPNRRAALAASDAAGRNTGPGCLAAAAAYSGGSLTPPRQAVVKPPEHLSAIFLNAALTVAAVTDAPNTAAHRVKFLALGQQVAAGQLKW